MKGGKRKQKRKQKEEAKLDFSMKNPYDKQSFFRSFPGRRGSGRKGGGIRGEPRYAGA
jgi:hypothetical protein